MPVLLLKLMQLSCITWILFYTEIYFELCHAEVIKSSLFTLLESRSGQVCPELLRSDIQHNTKVRESQNPTKTTHL